MIVLKALMIFFLGLWLLRSILRGLFGRVVNQAQQQQQRHFQQQQQQQQRRPGNINVNFNQKSRKNKTSDDYKGGDYIDYEEVD